MFAPIRAASLPISTVGAAASAAEESFGAAGLALFGALVAAFYSGLYAAYLADIDPWAWGIG